MNKPFHSGNVCFIVEKTEALEFFEHLLKRSSLCPPLCVIVGHDSYLERASQIHSDSPSQGGVLSISLPGNLVRTGVIPGLSQAANHIARALAAARRELSGTRFGASRALLC